MTTRTPTDTAVIEIATIVAGIIQRMGASYGSPDEWRRDFTRTVTIFENLSRLNA